MHGKDDKKVKKPWFGVGVCICWENGICIYIEQDGLRVWCGYIVMGIVLGYGVMVLGI